MERKPQMYKEMEKEIKNMRVELIESKDKLKEEIKNTRDELIELKKELRDMKKHWERREMHWEIKIKSLEKELWKREKKLENIQTTFYKLINEQPEREKKGAEVPANCVMAETTEANLVNNISREGKEIKIVFWNIAGLRKKCENEQFLEYIKKFDNRNGRNMGRKKGLEQSGRTSAKRI